MDAVLQSANMIAYRYYLKLKTGNSIHVAIDIIE